MPKLTGIDTGHRLRTLGDSGEISFLTNFNDFAADSHDGRTVTLPQTAATDFKKAWDHYSLEEENT